MRMYLHIFSEAVRTIESPYLRSMRSWYCLESRDLEPGATICAPSSLRMRCLFESLKQKISKFSKFLNLHKQYQIAKSTINLLQGQLKSNK